MIYHEDTRMARSKKDGKYGGGHKCWRGSWLKMDGRCGVNGKPTGVREPFNRKTKRFVKRLTSKSRRRRSKEILDTELSGHPHTPRRGGQWKGRVKMAEDFNEIPEEFEEYFR